MPEVPRVALYQCCSQLGPGTCVNRVLLQLLYWYASTAKRQYTYIIHTYTNTHKQHRYDEHEPELKDVLRRHYFGHNEVDSCQLFLRDRRSSAQRESDYATHC